VGLERLGECDYLKVHASNTKPAYIKLVRGRKIKRVKRGSVPRRCLRKKQKQKLSSKQDGWIKAATTAHVAKVAPDFTNMKAFVVNWQRPRKRGMSRLSVVDLGTGKVARDILELGERAPHLLAVDDVTNTLLFWNGLKKDPLILIDGKSARVTRQIKLPAAVKNFAPLKLIKSCGQDRLAVIGSSVINLNEGKEVEMVKDLVAISAATFDRKTCTLYYSHTDEAREKEGLHMTRIRAVSLKSGKVVASVRLGPVGHGYKKPPIMTVVKGLYISGGELLAVAGDGAIYPGHTHVEVDDLEAKPARKRGRGRRRK